MSGRRAAALPDPHTGTASRFPLVSCDDAFAVLRRFRPVGTELVAVEDLAGRVLARPVRAAIDVPHFARAYMDGYAVRAADTAGARDATPASLRVAGSVEMGAAAPGPVRRGQAMRIPTGGMLPTGADAVVMVEHTSEADGVVRIVRAATPGQHVMRRGEDMRRGAVLFPAGHRCRAHDVGALAGIGVSRALVHRRPRVAVIATGSEIVPPDVTPGPGQVRSINQYSLRAMIADYGGAAIDCGVIPDHQAAIARVFRGALRRADLVLFSGGSSVGTKDLTPAVIKGERGARILVHGIRIKPGKPTVIARVGGKPVLGLPGHPVSALVVFEVFAAPLLRRLGGESEGDAFTPHGRVPARLAAPLTSVEGRDDFVRVRLELRDGEWLAHPASGGSAEIASLVHSDGMVRVEAATLALPAGAPVVVQCFR
ncbi:MAG TPA: gephyrin-like molybdotransferase Glp [Candidatus Binatia bacterium]|jgi:molybdopterin molybdotransferase